MTIEEIIKGILYVGGTGAFVYLAQWAGAAGKAWLAHRKEMKSTESQAELDLKKLEALKAVDMANVSRQNFEVLMKSAVDMATAQTKRAELLQQECDEEKLLREKCEKDLSGEISNLKIEIGKVKGEHTSCHIVLEQVERNLRFLFNHSNIAYWEVDRDKKCTVNQIFNDITGLDSNRCSNDGWLEAVHPEDRQIVAYRWNNFRENFQTHTAFNFRFRHIESGKLTEVSVECNAIMLNGLEVYKYTARTKPIPAY